MGRVRALAVSASVLALLGCSRVAPANTPPTPVLPTYQPGDQAQVRSPLVYLCRDMPAEINVLWGTASDPSRVRLMEQSGDCARVEDHPHIQVIGADTVYGQTDKEGPWPVLQVRVLDGQHAGQVGYITTVSTVV